MKGGTKRKTIRISPGDTSADLFRSFPVNGGNNDPAFTPASGRLKRDDQSGKNLTGTGKHARFFAFQTPGKHFADAFRIKNNIFFIDLHKFIHSKTSPRQHGSL